MLNYRGTVECPFNLSSTATLQLGSTWGSPSFCWNCKI